MQPGRFPGCILFFNLLNMKILSIILTGLLLTNCASSNVPQKNMDFEELIISGKDVYFKDMTFEQDIDFTKFEKNLVSEGVYQVRIVSSITFHNCIFKGKVTTYTKDKDQNIIFTSFQSNVSFIGCAFHEEANFRASNILGRVDFTNALFLKKATFEECTFYQNAYFRASAYHEELRFQNAVFMQKANFLNAEFDNTASFQSVTFQGEAQFSNTKFMGYTDFGLIRCFGNFFANYALFHDRAIFNNGYYYSSADFISLVFHQCEMMSNRFFSEVRFTKSTAEVFVSFDKCYFLQGAPDFSSFDPAKISQVGIRAPAGSE